MKFISLSGREIAVDIRPSKWPRRKMEDCRSRLQWMVGQIIDELVPLEVVLEEFTIPRERLFLDFFLPRKRVAVEVQGIQHYTYTKHFHGNADGFVRSKKRDSDKMDWCRRNEITLIVLKYDLTDSEIRERLSVINKL